MKIYLLIVICVFLNICTSAKRGLSLLDKLFITSTEQTANVEQDYIDPLSPPLEIPFVPLIAPELPKQILSEEIKTTTTIAPNSAQSEATNVNFLSFFPVSSDYNSMLFHIETTTPILSTKISSNINSLYWPSFLSHVPFRIKQIQKTITTNTSTTTVPTKSTNIHHSYPFPFYFIPQYPFVQSQSKLITTITPTTTTPTSYINYANRAPFPFAVPFFSLQIPISTTIISTTTTTKATTATEKTTEIDCLSSLYSSRIDDRCKTNQNFYQYPSNIPLECRFPFASNFLSCLLGTTTTTESATITSFTTTTEPTTTTQGQQSIISYIIPWFPFHSYSAPETLDLITTTTAMAPFKNPEPYPIPFVPFFAVPPYVTEAATAATTTLVMSTSTDITKKNLMTTSKTSLTTAKSNSMQFVTATTTQKILETTLSET